MRKILKFIKEFNYVLFSFILLTGKCIITDPTISDAAVFLIISCLYGFFKFLESKKQPNINTKFETDIEALKNTVDSMKLGHLTKNSHQQWRTKI